MEGDDTHQQTPTADPHPQKVILPYQYFPIERGLFYTSLICMLLSIPISFLGYAISHVPFGFLCIVMLGAGIIFLAITVAIAETHFRRVSVSVLATVTRERRFVDNYFTPKQKSTIIKEPITKLPTIEVRFTTQSGELIILELLTNLKLVSDIGQPIEVFYIPAKPQVASIKGYSLGGFRLVVFYCLVGIVFIVAGFVISS